MHFLTHTITFFSLQNMHISNEYITTTTTIIMCVRANPFPMKTQYYIHSFPLGTLAPNFEILLYTPRRDACIHGLASLNIFASFNFLSKLILLG